MLLSSAQAKNFDKWFHLVGSTNNLWGTPRVCFGTALFHDLHKPKNLKLSADDTVLYESGVNAHASSLSLQKSLDKFCEWCSTNKLSINTKKHKN